MLYFLYMLWIIFIVFIIFVYLFDKYYVIMLYNFNYNTLCNTIVAIEFWHVKRYQDLTRRHMFRARCLLDTLGHTQKTCSAIVSRAHKGRTLNSSGPVSIYACIGVPSQCIISALTTLSHGVSFVMLLYRFRYIREKPIIFAFIISTCIMFNNVLRTFLPKPTANCS